MGVYAYTKKVVWLLSPVTSAPAGRKHGKVESITLSVAVGPRIPSVVKQEGAICRYILHYRRNKAHHSSGGLQRCGLQEMIFYTAYMEVPLWKNLQSFSSRNSLIIDENLIPIGMRRLTQHPTKYKFCPQKYLSAYLSASRLSVRTETRATTYKTKAMK
jgi:hypothetical protein